MALHRDRRQAIADHEDDVGFALHFGKLCERLRVQATAPIGAREISRTIIGPAPDLDHAPARMLEFATQGRHLERQMHGVTRLRMGEAEGEHLARRQAAAAATDRDARGGVTAQSAPGIERRLAAAANEVGLVAHEATAANALSAVSALVWRASRSRPRSSMICIFSSQASNSGACFRPRASRTYKAS